MLTYIIRLDDASDYMDIDKWSRIEKILDKFNIKPIVGIIPNNRDDSLINNYKKNDNFWLLVKEWERKKWILAMHGYEHKYVTEDGGINPVNRRSEFAGLSYPEQEEKIGKGYECLKLHNINPKIFFAPSHTFDLNTLNAIKNKTDIRIISDTVANDIYKFNDFYFIPQQSGKVRKLPFKVTTFCYHPNMMEDKDFIELENFLNMYKNNFKFDLSMLKDRKKSLYDKLLSYLYFRKRK